jgi:hypothetical protein
VVQATALGEGRGGITLRSKLPREQVEPDFSPECKL